MSTRPAVASQAPSGQPNAQARAILRNLTAKMLTYVARNELTLLRQMSEHLLDLSQQPGMSGSASAYRWRSASFLLDKQAAAPTSVYQDALKDTLQEEVRLALDAAARRDGKTSLPSDSLEGMTLSLIDVTEMDRLLSVDQITQRFNDRYESILGTLNQRLGMLISGEVMVLTSNPFRPEVLVRSLMQGWQKSGFEEQICNDLLTSLDPKFSLDLAPLYEDMSSTLEQAGVAVKTTHRIRKAAGADTGFGASGMDGFPSSQQASGFGDFSQSAQGSDYMGLSLGIPPSTYGGPIDGIARGPQTGAAHSGASPASAVGAPTATEYGRLGPLGHSLAAHARHFLQMLGFGLSGGGVTASVPREIVQTPADPGLRGYLGGLQANGGAVFLDELDSSMDLASHNVLRRMRDQEEIQQAAEIDRGTVDALAEVFDYVFGDVSIPAQLKVIIGRLQIPVLKAAMIDREFFHSAEHPARKLIDALAQASVTWNVDKGEQDPLYQQIENTVNRALNEFEDDLSLFGELLLEFEDFRAQSEEQAQQHIEPVARVEQTDEALALALAHADEVVAARINALPPDKPLAPLLLPFLTTQWREVMAQAWLQVRAQPELWNSALTTMDRLIWSTQPQAPVQVERRQRDPSLTPQPGDRRQLVRILPELIRSLEAGLASIQWHGQARDEFMAGLMELHMHAVRTAPLTQEELDRRTRETQAAQEALRALDERRAQAKVDATDEFDQAAQAMSRGMWFDYLTEKGQLHRCRLSWISPKRTRLLFTNREGFDAFVRSEREVAELLRQGRLTEIEQTPIVGRALDQILANA